MGLVYKLKNICTLENCAGVLTVIVAVLALILSYQHNLILIYDDGNAHLNTARRVFDSLTPGLVQLGSVWLPLLHILMLPFIANFFLWQSGLAGSLVSMASFFASAYFAWQTVYLFSKNRYAAFVGLLFVILNVALLYMQTTPMFEPLSLATMFGSVYFLAKWGVEQSLLDLLLGAFFTMLFSMTRYDGWAFFLAGIVYIAILSLVKYKRLRLGNIILYLCLGGFGIFLWIMYNWVIFGDPLFFQRGEFSSYMQQQILFHRGQLPTFHDVLLDIKAFSLASLLNIGIIGAIGLILGLLIFLKDKFLHPSSWGPFLLFVTFAFNIYSLYSGNSVIWMPMLPPYFPTYYNARYGLEMIPAAAFFGGYLASKSKIVAMLLTLLLLLQPILFFHNYLLDPIFHTPIGIISLQDTTSSLNVPTEAASNYVHAHYHGGLILVSSASADSFIFHVGVPLKEFITEGTGEYWKSSLGDPARYATWVVFFGNKTDRVGKRVADSPILKKDFTRVYYNDTYQIWEKV